MHARRSRDALIPDHRWYKTARALVLMFQWPWLYVLAGTCKRLTEDGLAAKTDAAMLDITQCQHAGHSHLMADRSDDVAWDVQRG
jgi:hypothetical protein